MWLLVIVTESILLPLVGTFKLGFPSGLCTAWSKAQHLRVPSYLLVFILMRTGDCVAFSFFFTIFLEHSYFHICTHTHTLFSFFSLTSKPMDIAIILFA